MVSWLSGWSYRKQITISAGSGAGTDYQVKMEIASASGIGTPDFHLEGHCTDFPNDIRFTDDDGTTLLDYWIEDETADPITAWVKVADDLSSSNVDIYCYYGKSGAASGSDGDVTFIFFDPCDDLSQWTKYTGGTGDVTISSGRFRFYAGSGNANKETIKTGLLGLTNIAVHWKIYHEGNLDYTWKMWVTPENPTSVVSGPTNDGHQFTDQDYSASYEAGHRMLTGGTELFKIGLGDTPDSTWQKDELRSKSGKQEILWDGVSKDSQTETHTWSDLRLVMAGGSAWNRAHDFYVDDIFIRKYVSPEPTFSLVGAEETPVVGPPPHSWGQVIG